MPFERPTLPMLLERSAADIEAWMPGGDAHVPSHKLHLLGKVNAGAAHGQHGHLAWLAKQLLPDQSEWETLLRWGSLWGLAPLTASGAYGDLPITGQPYALIKAGATFQRADGWEYVVSQTINLDAAGNGLVPVVSLVGGYAGNCVAGTDLRLSRAVAGISASVKVGAKGVTKGADAESLESFRERVTFRLRNPPQGGALNDYVAWARAAHPAVTRAWAYSNQMGPNTITVRLVCDHDPAGLIPSQALLDEVYAYIRERMPATPVLYVIAPIPKVVDVRVVVSPDTPVVREAVSLEIQDWFLVDPDIRPEGTVYMSRLSEAISKAKGERSHILLLPIKNQPAGPGEIQVPGVLYWSET
ncbi:baseplate J/gp47 family protein [Pseudomonas sp. D47]|uniref:baseplate J/gp47 family protein n=1 Tax=Pseudomonas sp. D47 TaxID=3159447 RepID=UPI00387B8256